MSLANKQTSEPLKLTKHLKLHVAEVLKGWKFGQKWNMMPFWETKQNLQDKMGEVTKCKMFTTIRQFIIHPIK